MVKRKSCIFIVGCAEEEEEEPEDFADQILVSESDRGCFSAAKKKRSPVSCIGEHTRTRTRTRTRSKGMMKAMKMPMISEQRKTGTRASLWAVSWAMILTMTDTRQSI